MYQNGWLAFELNILRRLRFSSVAIPLSWEPYLGLYLKRWKIQVTANHTLQSSLVKAQALIENNSNVLSEEEVEVVLEDAYVPYYQLNNHALRKWFGETDAWWFDNVRRNIEKLETNFSKSIAFYIAMQVGDYALSFSEETRHLRQPLSKVFKRLWVRHPAPVENEKRNFCQFKSPNDFIAEHKRDLDFVPDLMFLRLPPLRNVDIVKSLGWKAWREEWLRQADNFWHELELSYNNKLTAKAETKSQYLKLIEDFLQTASHVEKWAISFVEDGITSTQELIETIGRVRKVETVYTKDFSELTGKKAVIITA
ncbi:MAG: hypothetical protein N2Z23_02500 [Pyrinomonadaceae bacterium]|nr:hypothetical protein [Pyrinomonadaceae bacterium]MCX7639301.1 hypothetical protein [Pyrinomonadaceae bacterium]MDW8303477.1 hypothetical protein [Acidobacteriota bacterium]